MPKTGKADGFIVAGLLLLSSVSLVAGAFRVAELASRAPITPENARFIASPAPVVIHIVSALLFCVLGAFQFSPNFRRAKPNWHRLGGRLAAPMGFAAALSGLWMTLFYPWTGFDGHSLYVIRLLVGLAMSLSVILAVKAILRRDFQSHAAWMARAYVLGIGAGTQVLTHIPWFAFPEIQGELARAICMSAGWAINIGIAEYAIARMESVRRGP